jgi:dolichol-phosphate mannosyltransferase
MDLSVVIPAWNEADNLRKLIPSLHQVLAGLGIEYEIMVVDNHSSDGTADIGEAEGATVIQQTDPGYGGALWSGFKRASGPHILTMDADLSHPPDFVPTMWAHRDEAEVVIASRYVEGGEADMPAYRHVLSVILNWVFTRALSLPVQDISSGFRLYHTAVVRDLELESSDFDALEEILIKCYASGCKILEVPMHYVPRDAGKSKVQLFKFAVSYLRTLVRMWRLRNSISSSDYDARAYNSPIIVQRYWQRKRFAIVMDMCDGRESTLDIGCGSSKILGSLCENSVGVDIVLGRLRYSRCYSQPLANASIFALPFPDGAFNQVLCSQVIEHVEAGDRPFLEMSRVLKPGGRLILGTPDYGGWSWPTIERMYRLFAPDAYGDQHITHYTREGLTNLLQSMGFRLLQARYILGGEMILLLTKDTQGS